MSTNINRYNIWHTNQKLLQLSLLLYVNELQICTAKKNRRKPRFWVRKIYQNRHAQGDYRNLVQEMRLHDDECILTILECLRQRLMCYLKKWALMFILSATITRQPPKVESFSTSSDKSLKVGLYGAKSKQFKIQRHSQEYGGYSRHAS